MILYFQSINVHQLKPKVLPKVEVVPLPGLIVNRCDQLTVEFGTFLLAVKLLGLLHVLFIFSLLIWLGAKNYFCAKKISFFYLSWLICLRRKYILLASDKYVLKSSFSHLTFSVKMKIVTIANFLFRSEN